MRRYAYKWDKLCAQYGLCDQKSFKTGDVFPTKLPSPDVSLSDYYDDITYDLDDLITKFKVYTKKNISVASDRYHLKNIFNLMMLHYYHWIAMNIAEKLIYLLYFIEITNQTFMETNLVGQGGHKSTSHTLEDAFPLQHRETFIRQ